LKFLLKHSPINTLVLLGRRHFVPESQYVIPVRDYRTIVVLIADVIVQLYLRSKICKNI
jgi:hypothetical protein